MGGIFSVDNKMEALIKEEDIKKMLTPKKAKQRKSTPKAKSANVVLKNTC